MITAQQAPERGEFVYINILKPNPCISCQSFHRLIGEAPESNIILRRRKIRFRDDLTEVMINKILYSDSIKSRA